MSLLTQESRSILPQLPQEVINKVVIVICFSCVIGLLFNLVPNTEHRNYFLFGGVEMNLKTHAYFAFDHLSRLMLVYAVVLLLPGATVLFWIEFGDLVDYLICYNSTWVTIFDYNFEYNDLKLITVGLWMAWRLGRQ